MLATQAPFIAYTGLDGLPLNDGEVFFGVANLNPESNPIVVYWDGAGTQPASQPIQTSNGFTVRSGTPAAVYAAGDYSINVRDKTGRLVYFAPSSALLSNDTALAAQITAYIASLAASNGSSLVGFIQGLAGAVARTEQSKLRDIVSVFDFMTPTQIADVQAGTLTQDVTAAVQAAITAAVNFGKILFPPGSYKTTSALVVSPNAIRITLSGYGATINCAHNGNGLTLTSTNEAFGGHVLEGLTLQGPNVSYPTAAQLAGTSTGWGIGMQSLGSDAVSGYNTVLRSVTVQGFLYGLYMQAAINTSICDASMFRYNQYGVYIDAGQSNGNNFFGAHIRENRIAGVYSTGITGPGANATANSFFGGVIETNVPFKSDTWAGTGGYNPVFDSSGVGVGVFMLAAYGWNFDGTYFENHNYSIWLGVGAAGSSSQSHFRDLRFTPGGIGLVRKSGVKLSGANVQNNVFDSVRMISADMTTVNVEMDNATQTGTQFIDCDGFNFITASLIGTPDVINARTYASGGMTDACIKAPQGNASVDASVGTARGQISASTGSITLNAQGLPEAHIGAVTTGPISITQFTNTTPLSFFMLIHSGSANNITVVSGAMGIAANILLKNATNAVLTATGNFIYFWINKYGQATEIARNF